MEEYTESDEVKESLASGGTGDIGGGSGIERAAAELAAGTPPEAEPEPAKEAPDDADIDSKSPADSTAVEVDAASKKNHEVGTNEDVMDEDSPIFLTAVSHTTESDAAGGNVSDAEAPGGADVTKDVKEVKIATSAIGSAESSTNAHGIVGEIRQNAKDGVAGGISADPKGEEIEKRNQDPDVDLMKPNTTNKAPEKDVTEDANSGKANMELNNEGSGGSAVDEANGKNSTDGEGADPMAVVGTDKDRNQSNPPAKKDPRSETTAAGSRSDEDPCADLVGVEGEEKVKESSVQELTKDNALRALKKMPLPTEQAARKTSLGRPACALDGCNNVEQGRRNHFFCKKHCRMWREANRKAKPSGGGTTSDSAIDGATSTDDADNNDASACPASTSASKRRNARKRKEYDDVVAVGNAGEVVSEEVSMRSSKRERRARSVRAGTTTQDQHLEGGHDEELQAALRLSIEEKVKSSPRKASAVAASAVSHPNKKRRSTRSSSDVDRPSLVNQVVRLTDKGREEMGNSRFIDGIDPLLYFVFNYNHKNDECELVPMRTKGKFNARESKNFPQSKGRDKWMLYSEKECKGQAWKVRGRALEIVSATTIVNTADADDERWDVHEAVEIPNGEDAGTNLEKKSAAKFCHKQTVYGKEEDGIFYKAKVKKKRYKENSWEYELHFVGWAAKYDRWVPEHDIVKELPPGETAGAIPNSSPEKKKSTPSSTSEKKRNRGDGSSESTGTSIIYAKCSSSNDDRSPSHHYSTDGEEMLQVERILGRRWNTRSRQIEFLTVWRGFDEPSEYTWEPESNFSIRSLAIFKQMWGKANEPPLDGKEEMLSKRDIEKLKELESSRGTKAASSTYGSTEASSSTVSSSSPSSSVRRSTRIRTTTVLELTEPGDGGGKMDEVGSMNAKSSLSSDWSNASRNTSGVVWTPVNECILLLTALEHPEDLVSNGPGVWMVTKSEWLFEGAFPKTDRQVRHHFEEMTRRRCDRLADHSAVNYARHILNFALASAPPSAQAKNLALVAAGWYRIAGGSELDCSKATWHPPLLDFKASYCRYSEAQTKELAVTLDVAWKEHENQIRESIEEAWVPSVQEAETIDIEEDKATVQVDDEEVATKQEDGDNQEGETVSYRAPVAMAVEREVTTGIEPKKMESNELADWNQYRKFLNERKEVVQDGDPRPSLTCRWCGARPFDLDCYESKAMDQIFEYRDVPATCKACKYLEELGWKLNIIVKVFSPTSSKRKAQHRKGQGFIKAIPPVGRQVESVKEFLRISTAIVSEEFSKNHALNTPSTLVGDKSDEGKSLKRRSKVVPSTSTADDSEQKGGEDNGAIVDNEAPKASRRLRPKTKIIKPALPTFDYLLTLERGLVTVLESDCLHVWNAHYGSNSTVALWTLRSLAAGKLPRAVQFETPFFRPRDELNVMGRKGGAPPTRFLGVSRIIQSNVNDSNKDKQQYTGKFGVEFPLFDTNVDPLVPKSATITGRTVLIRNDLTEDVAGRLYAFMFRLLYGTAVVERMLQKTNSLVENASLVQDTLRAFGADEEDKEAPNP